MRDCEGVAEGRWDKLLQIQVCGARPLLAWLEMEKTPCPRPHGSSPSYAAVSTQAVGVWLLHSLEADLLLRPASHHQAASVTHLSFHSQVFYAWRLNTCESSLK